MMKLNLLLRRTVFGFLLALLFVLPLQEANAQAACNPLAGGTLDVCNVPKYVTPLVIPPVMKNNGTADKYDISVRQFQQQILPSGYSPTTLWGYGPAGDPTPGVAPDPGSQFNYPAYTIETTSNAPVDVKWINDLVDADGNFLPHLLSVDQTLHWANPAQTLCKDGTFRKDCATEDPSSYVGPVPIVTHVHGAHVEGHSDGYPEAWWLPAANNIPASYAKSGTLFDDATGANSGNLGYADYLYKNDQPATTLWYHDHSLGLTRLNVYAGPAGFWLIRGGAFDSITDGLTSSPGVLPGPAPTAGQGVISLNTPGDPTRGSIREIPIVIQDRAFNADGSLFYPEDRAFFEGLDPSQLQIPFVPDSDIAPAWNPEAFFNTMVVNGVTWPTLDVAPAKYRFRLLNGSNSRFLNLSMFKVDPLTGSTTPIELPFYQIGGDQGFLPSVVEVRTGFMTAIDPAIIQKIGAEFTQTNDEINGEIAKLQAKLAGTTKPEKITEINGEIAKIQAEVLKKRQKVMQKLISKTVGNPTPGPSPLQALLMAPAERADVIVDFSGMQAGDIVRIINTGPDAPFGGFPDVPADQATTGQVMEFVVNSALLGKSPTDPVLADGVTPNPAAATDPISQLINAEPASTAPINITKTLSLNEEESETHCVSVDLLGNVVVEPGIPPLCAGGIGVPMAPKAALLGTLDSLGNTSPLTWSKPMTERPRLGDTQLWEVYNLTVDGHPIHLHLVRFEVVDRQALNPVTNLPMGLPLPPEANEAGYKDTVIAYPGEVTRLKATFDIAGLYVWHCHIVEHEDNEMMRPYCVDNADGSNACGLVP